MLECECGLKMYVMEYPLSYKFGAQDPPFWTILQFNGNFNGLYLRN